MMGNGYRLIDECQADMLDRIEALASELDSLVQKLQTTELIVGGEPTGDKLFDQRWVATGKTDLQKGMMCLRRAVNKQESF